MIKAVLDETSLRPAAGAANLPKEFRGLSDILEQLRKDEVIRSKHSDVWYAPVAEGLALCDILFEKGYLDDGLRLSLQAAIDRLKNWNEAGQAISSPQYVASELAKKIASACVTLPENSGIIQIGGNCIYRVGNQKDLVKFYRQAPQLGQFSKECVVRHASLAFPNLFLRSGIEQDIDKFSTGYPAILADLIDAFSDLNDVIFPLSRKGIDGREIVRRFNAHSRFTVSPDSPKTHKNKKAMEKRDVNFGKKVVRCEWHVKLHPTHDRIHFSFGDAAVIANKILVGIFTDHLPI